MTRAQICLVMFSVILWSSGCSSFGREADVSGDQWEPPVAEASK